MRTIALAGIVSLLLAGCTAGTHSSIEPASGAAGRAVSHEFSVTPLDVPAGQFPDAVSTAPTGIRGILVTATVALQGGSTVGATYRTDTKTWQQIEYPGAASTAAYGPDLYSTAYRLVGSYKKSGETNDHGFVYDAVAKTYTTIDAPAGLCAPKKCNETIAHSSYGDANYVVVGNADAVSASASPVAALGHAFLYDGKTFANIDVSGALSTTAYGVWKQDRATIVAGGFGDAKGVHAYVRDLTAAKTFLTYDYPGSKLTHFEGITGLPGAGNYNVVGDYTNAKDGAAYGFFMQIRDWKPWPPIVIGKLSANSVSNRTVIGVYSDAGAESGYTTNIPIQDPP